jgi:PAS domain S-box-containing protein
MTSGSGSSPSAPSSASTSAAASAPMTPMTTMRRYNRLARATDDGLEALATFAASALSMQLAVIGLLDEKRQWFSATIGGGGLGERLAPFLAFGLLDPRGVEIPDLAAVPALASDPLVRGEPGFRALVARRLALETGAGGDAGQALGVLLLLDQQPRKLGARELGLVDLLAEQTRAALAVRRELRALRDKHRRDLASLELLDGVLRASSGVGIVACDLAGRVTAFNRGAERLFGVARVDVVGARVLADLLEPHELGERLGDDRTIGALAALRDEPGSLTEWSVGPERRPISLEIEPLTSEEGEATGFAVVAHDLTAKKAADELRRESVSMVSHELRTPLTSILGALRLVGAGVTGALPADAADMVQIALANAERLGRLVDDLLDLQKVEAGRAELRRVRCDLRALVAQAIEANRPYAEPLEVTLELAPRPPTGAAGAAREDAELAVGADPDRLLQVLANLLSNAAKVSPSGGAVTVDLARTRGGVRVSVRDRGPGIPEWFRPRVFQKFAQAQSGGTVPPPETHAIRGALRGTGLGLSIVRALIGAHGGTVGFDTETGRGTTFWFELPAP